MSNVDPEKVITAIASGSAFAVALWTKLSQRRTQQHATDDGQSEAIAALQKRCDGLSKRVEQLEGERSRLEQLERERPNLVRREEWQTLDAMAQKTFKQLLGGQARILRRLKGPPT